jgi:hypothetical protein
VPLLYVGISLEFANNFHERNAQVARMGRIFHDATKVLVWLGQAADDGDLLFEHIKPRG